MACVKNLGSMKHRNLTPILLSAVALGLGSLSTHAATSGVVGAASVAVPAGSTIYSLPFLQSAVSQSATAAVSGSDVTLGANIPALTGSHYLHVLSGTDVGMIYDIASYIDATVTLTAGSTNIAPGDIVAVRPHMTIADLGVPANFTTITLLNPDGTTTVGTYVFGSWDISPDTVIRPGEGFVLGAPSPFTMTLHGAVSEDNVIFPVSSPAVVGTIDPVNGTANVLTDLIATAPNFSTLTELTVGGNVNVFTNAFGWNPDPTAIDTADLKGFVLAPGGQDPFNITLPGNVIAP